MSQHSISITLVRLMLSRSPMLRDRKLEDYTASLLRVDSKAFSVSKGSKDSAPAGKDSSSIHGMIRAKTPDDFVLRNKAFFTPVLDLRALKSEDLDSSCDHETIALSMCLIPSSEWNSKSLIANIEASLPPRPNAESKHTEGVDAGALERTVGSDKLLQDWKSYRSRLFAWFRWALLGGAPGPALPDAMVILGNDICKQRLQDAVRVSRSLRQERLGKPSFQPARLGRPPTPLC